MSNHRHCSFSFMVGKRKILVRRIGDEEVIAVLEADFSSALDFDPEFDFDYDLVTPVLMPIVIDGNCNRLLF